jgi:tetratricopeptide (TPR) repeat protein
MRTFAQLLTEYIERAGISDAELARTLGVRRQTIFRWKEGLSERPRHREDVLRLAMRLRLAPDERDLLLLAAGFAPESPAPPANVTPILSTDATQSPPVPTTGQISTSGETDPGVLAPQAGAVATPSAEKVQAESAVMGNDRLPFEIGAAPGIAPASHSPRLGRRRVPAWAWGALALVSVVLVALAAVFWPRPPAYPVARPGETLILVARFSNYGGGQQGYNVTGRLQTALEREIQGGRLERVRVAPWPAEIRDEAGAADAAHNSGAAMVIWGEYDSGRVLTHFTAARPELAATPLEKLLSSPADLPATINSTLPEEVRHIALLTLGRLYISQNDMARARAVLVQALSRLPAERDAAGSLYFWLGFAYQSGADPDLARAISFYARALEQVPNMTSARNNRAIAHLHLGTPADFDAALDDLTQVVEAAPDDPTAYNNRAVLYTRRGGPGDREAALADLDAAIRLAPGGSQAYFNRGLIYQQMGVTARWQADLKRALGLAPDNASVLNALCWGYALDAQAAQALPYCDRAVAVDLTGASHDSRGVVYAELDRLPEAAAEIRAFLDWAAGEPVAEAPAGDYAAIVPERRSWLAALQAGHNPIDHATLQHLRTE